MTAGVYAIQHLKSGRTYIGSSSHMRRRWSEHRSKLNHGVHCNHAMQADWLRDGASAFVFVELEYLSESEMRVAAEQVWIDRTALHYNANHRAGSGPAPGYKHSELSKHRMSIAKKGKPKSDAHRAAISRGRQGMKLSEAHRQSIGNSRRGKRHSVETRIRQSVAVRAWHERRKSVNQT